MKAHMPMHTAEIRKKKYRFSFRESGSDRNFGYFQSLPTVCRTLSYTHTHTSVSKMVATKRHLLDVLALCVWI